jgi:maltooligosyltrehalose trehalohydrolase
MVHLKEVGAFCTSITSKGVEVRFGIYLPRILPKDGYELVVKVIHKDDRFDPNIKTQDYPLQYVAGSENDLWQTEVTIPEIPNTQFGQPGTYLYRYQLLQTPPGSSDKRLVTLWFTDPFARKTDVGRLSAFVTPGFIEDFVWEDQSWKVPEVEDLIVYELHVAEFNSTFDGVIERLSYLKSLGVNCLELMPVSSTKLDFDWGYGPLHYFAPAERWGGTQGMKRLVNACHKAGVAVILDVVYQHVDPNFPYHLVYQDARLPSPMIGKDGDFGPQIDYSNDFAIEYVQNANQYWLDEYHVDGFRFDEVTDLFDGPTGRQYPRMAFDAYTASFKYPRFTPSGGTKDGEYSRILLVPEALNRPQQILNETYSNGTWQDGLLNKAEDMARWQFVDEQFVHLLDTRFSGYPLTKTVQDRSAKPVERPVAPYQYIESHDHSQLIYFVKATSEEVPFGDRNFFYKLQPFVIALYTCEGIPMLWEGQEFAQNYFLPSSGNGRICFQRNVNWEYFYDINGQSLVRLYRILGSLRHKFPALRSRESFYFNVDSRPGEGAVAYRRSSSTTGQDAIVFLNFSDFQRTLRIPFPKIGTYREMIDDTQRSTPLEVIVTSPGEFVKVDIPPNYGWIFVG